MRKLIILLLLALMLWVVDASAAISLDGSCTSSTTACTVGTGGSGSSSSGDYVLVFAERIASTTKPTIPASNTQIACGGTGCATVGATTSYIVYCHVASGTGDSTGTVANATGGVIAFWFSGTSATTTAACATQGVSIGIVSAGNQQYSASGTTATYSALASMSSGTTTSWVVGFMGTNTSADACVPSALTNPTTQAGYVTGGTSNAAVASWAQTTCTITT